MPLRDFDIRIAYSSLEITSQPGWAGEIPPGSDAVTPIREMLLRRFGPKITALGLEYIIDSLKTDRLWCLEID